MYQINSYTATNKVYKSAIFESAWATNMIAISYIRNNKEIEKTYKRG